MTTAVPAVVPAAALTAEDREAAIREATPTAAILEAAVEVVVPAAPIVEAREAAIPMAEVPVEIAVTVAEVTWIWSGHRICCSPAHAIDIYILRML